MSRRVRVSAPDSLELLLDTLCNTFGGILFIAILVVLLLQMSQPEPVFEEETKDQSVELVEDNLQSELNGIQSNIEAQKRMLQSLMPTQWANENKVLQETVAKITSTSQRIQDVQERTTESQVEKEKMTDGLLNSKRRLEDIEKELATAQSERKLVESRSERQTELPVSRNPTARPVAVVLRYGRMYIWHHYVDGKRAGLNTDDFIVIKDTTAGLLTRPKVTAGVDLSNPDTATGEIRSRLSQFNRDQYYLDLAIHVDSFDEFSIFRRIISKLGYYYSVYPMSEGDVIVDRGGTGRRIQ